MVRYVFVAGLYASAVLAAPAPGQDAAAAPAGWSDGNPPSGSSFFGWAKSKNKPDSAANAPEAGPHSLFAPPAGPRDWANIFGGLGGNRGDGNGKGSGAGSGASPSRDWGSLFGGGSRGGSDSNAPPSKPSSGGGLFGGMFGGGNRPRPASSGSPSSSGSGFSWGRPQSQKPKPEWKPKEDAWPKEQEPKTAQPVPEVAQPKPEPAEAAKEAPKPSEPAPEVAKSEPAPEVAKPEPAPEAANPEPASEVAKPEPASEVAKPEPAPEVAKPEPASEVAKPEPAQPVPDAAIPEPAVPIPEAAAPAPAQPVPEVAKPDPAQPVPEAAAPAPAQPVPKVAKPDPKPVAETAKAEPKPSKPDTVDVAEEADVQGKNVCAPKKYSKLVDIESVRRKLWQPSVGAKWQIILDGVPDTKGPMEPKDATVWDVDAWDARPSDICEAKRKGKKVICYFSAGTSESWRKDNHLIAPYNIGKICADTEVKKGSTCKNFWKGEMWIDIRNPVAWDVMKGRIKMAADKGCDAVDPDNMDIYDNEVLSTNATYGPLGKNVKFSENDSVKYLKFMADEAAKYGMSIGLKNSLSIVPKVKSFVQFAVNEECAKINECNEYKEFLAVKKPIFHIEYTGAQGSNNHAATKTTYKDPAGATKKYCNPLHEGVSRFSTIIKAGETLGNHYLYCDGKPAGFTKMAFYVDKDKDKNKDKDQKGKGKGNFVQPTVDSEDLEEETMDVEEDEDSTTTAEVESTTKRIVKRRAPIKRRHHRWAELERNPDWTG